MHPYAAYEGSPLWNAVSKAIAELVKNGDLLETTAHPYVVRYNLREGKRIEKAKG
jgi:lipid II:glycine glycyltransferase (peptidoglycan interpeptide bridge formation enzyme)